MTSKDLALSIISYHIKAQYEKWMKSEHEGIRKDGERMYSSLENYFQYMKSNSGGSCGIRISQKQFNFMSTLMRNEKIDRIQFEGFWAELGHPTYLTSAYGGFVGKKADHSKFLLKIKSIY